MIDRSRYFSRIDTKPSRSDYKAIKERTITLLKEHPHGIPVNELARACGLSSTRLISLMLRERFTDLPIGYDRRIDNRVYWVGAR
jgi:hypothetical protein|nr:MAG TPA: helix-turn-helix domain protein [Caudoviricetes sp.]